MSHHRIVVLARPFALRAEEPGLRSCLGADRAAVVSRALLLDIVVDLRARGFDPVVAWEGDSPPPECGLSGVESWPSGVGDLRQRLELVFARATADGSPAIVIGSDTPGMPPDLIEGAIRRLEGPSPSYDAVVIPSHDGEFHLLGLRQFAAGLFDGVRWGTQDSCESLVGRLRERGLRTAVLEPWFEIEEASGLDRLVGILQRRVVRAPHTSAALGFSGGF